MPTIIFNGKTYNAINDMPANERQAFEQMSQMLVDKNGNGIPDFLEGDVAMNVMTASSGRYVVEGKTYSSVNEMPEDMRNKVKSAFDMMANMGLVSKSAFVQISEANNTAEQNPAMSKPVPTPQSSTVIEEERGGNTFTLILGGMVLCSALAAVAMVIYYLVGR